MSDKKKQTVFQKLTSLFGNSTDQRYDYSQNNNTATTGIINPQQDDIVYIAKDEQDYQQKKVELRQQQFLANQWKKANRNMSNAVSAGISTLKMMYRDCDLMDTRPEIGAALDIYADESCTPNKEGFIVNVYSKSNRVKSILQDLLVNRLSIQSTLPMISRGTCKYGNTFMLLNIDSDNGVMGWRQLPVYEIERYDEGMEMPYNLSFNQTTRVDLDTKDGTKFVWVGGNDATPYRNWQIAHFRLLYDSRFLPYGCSVLNKARRHFRMLSIMEDAMLLYRSEKAMDRRIYKVYVGNISEDDVPAYMEQFVNNVKRTPIFDQETGQLDLRRNVLPVWKETPIQLVDGRILTIEEMAKEYERGKINKVYSVQDGTHKIVHGEVVWCGKSYTADALTKIETSNNGVMYVAPEHEILVNNFEKKRADKICVGDVLISKKNSSIDMSVTVKSVTTTLGDDVYCMTVKGSKGENDRHNFLLLLLDNKTNAVKKGHGVFVSNCTDDDLFIPVRDESASTPVETLSAGNNEKSLEDVKYIQSMLYQALRIPQSFTDYSEGKNDGKNLSMSDFRFAKTINRVQQMLLMELNKICIIHLYLLGFVDDLTNFTLTMNNPSMTTELFEVDSIQKKVDTARNAVSDPGQGIPLYSMERAWKEILGWSEKEIEDNLNELRLEKALSDELANTNKVISKTGIFDKVDNIYKSIAPINNQQVGNEDNNGGDNGGGMPPLGGGGGGGLDFGGGDFGGDLGGEGEDVQGDMGEMSVEDNSQEELNTEPPQESASRKNKPLLNDNKIRHNFKKNVVINEEVTSLIDELKDRLRKK